MKRLNEIMIIKKITVLLLLLSCITTFGQLNPILDCDDPNNQCARNGSDLPVRGEVKVLIIFAEIDYNSQNPTCSMPKVKPGIHQIFDESVIRANHPLAFLPGTLPEEVTDSDPLNDYIDLAASSNPQGVITKYYHTATLGELSVVGDYYPEVVKVPCANYSGLTFGYNRDVINEIRNNPKWINGDEALNGTRISDFDQYSGSSYRNHAGSDGELDAVIILWRNTLYGFGVGNNLNLDITPSKKVGLFGAWSIAKNPDYNFFQAEYFHAMFGGNNYHTGSGASIFSFPFGNTGSYGMTAQAQSASYVVSGWDRWFLDLKGNRPYPISAKNNSGQLVNTDMSIESHPNGGIYTLDDFVTDGDAIRIKLPHIDWQTQGNTLNQYLWIENHQKISSIDQNQFTVCNNLSNINTINHEWSKGLYMYVQVGKDRIRGSGISSAEPNTYGDYLFPLSAEGRHDFYYHHNLIKNKGEDSRHCVWGNAYIPYSIEHPDGSTTPNAFTGYTDQFGFIDTDGNGIINDPHQLGIVRVDKDGNEISLVSHFGDELDAFNQTGQKVYLGSNPAPVPVYTHNSGTTSNVFSHNNRTIWLNGLSIELLDVNNNTGKIKVQIKWDDYEIKDDTRWCGYIRLKDDTKDPLGRVEKIIVSSGKTLELDRGKSPTYLRSAIVPGYKDFTGFTEPTVLTIETGTTLELNNQSILKILNGSSLVVQDGATLKINGNGYILVDETSHICISENANLILPTNHGLGGIYTLENGGYFQGNLDNTTGEVPFFALGFPIYQSVITAGQGLEFQGVKSKGIIARNDITILPGAHLVPESISGEFCLKLHTAFQDCNSIWSPTHSGADPFDPSTSVLGDHNHGIHSHLPFDVFIEEELSSSHAYPNPTTGQINLPPHVNGKLFDISGNKLRNISSSEDNIDLSEFETGIYLLQIDNGTELITEKIMLQK